MTLTERAVCPGPINLISTDHFWIAIIAAALGSCLSLQIFSFVVGAKTEPIKETETIASDGDGNLGAEINVASALPGNNRPEVRLAEAYDSIGDTSAI